MNLPHVASSFQKACRRHKHVLCIHHYDAPPPLLRDRCLVRGLQYQRTETHYRNALQVVYAHLSRIYDTAPLTLSQCPLLADQRSKSILLSMSTANPASMDEPGDLEGSSPASQPRAPDKIGACALMFSTKQKNLQEAMSTLLPPVTL